MNRVVRRSLARAARDDRGFTLIEMVVAMVIIMLVLSAVIGVYIGSLRTVAQAKQRQTATALATQTLERLRALPYDAIRIGINKSTAAFTNDPNIADKATTPRLAPAVGGINETLVVTDSQPTAPLSNHRTTTTTNGVTYTVGVYVTQAATPQAAFNLTALVTYQSKGGGGIKTIVERTTAFSPSGCLSTSTHPFAGPCQASFSAQAGITAGSVMILNPDAADQPITGLDGTIGLELPGLSTSAAVEQTTTLSAIASTMAANSNSSGLSFTSGGQTAATAADSDPSSATAAAFDSKVIPAQTSLPRSISGTAGSVTATPTTSDTGNATSQVAAGATGCVATDGTAIVSGQPCASGLVQPQGAAGSIQLNLTGAAPVRSLPAFSLASVAATASPTRAIAGRFTAGNAATCTNSATPNCAHASISRNVGDVTIGQVPARSAGDSGPAAFNGAFSVTGLVENARAESSVTGAGARPPLLARSAGTVNYWNGATYTTLQLKDVTADQVINTPLATMTYKGVSSPGVEISVSSRIKVSQPRMASTTPAGCSAAVCTAEATSTSTVTADTTYVIKVDGVALTRFVVRLDLGALVAETSFKAAPLA